MLILYFIHLLQSSFISCQKILFNNYLLYNATPLVLGSNFGVKLSALYSRFYGRWAFWGHKSGTSMRRDTEVAIFHSLSDVSDESREQIGRPTAHVTTSVAQTPLIQECHLVEENRYVAIYLWSIFFFSFYKF